jgi:hypothetical protein
MMATSDNTTIERARQRLIALHGANDEGLWAIHGEDPNVDLGGSHIEPHIETVEGKYGDVVDYALSLPGFFNWGHGGSVRKIEVKRKVDQTTIGRRAELLKKRAELQRQIDEVDAEL